MAETALPMRVKNEVITKNTLAVNLIFGGDTAMNMLKRLHAGWLLLIVLYGFAGPAAHLHAQAKIRSAAYLSYFPQKQCSEVAFKYALAGYNRLKARGWLHNRRYLTVIDFTKPSNRQRFFVLDLQQHRLVVSSVTAHGVGSDPDSTTIPYRFSNTEGSRMSSVGFYITGDTYYNHRPNDSLGLCLFGVDKGFNDSAAAREVVVHYGASETSGKVYVTATGAARSFGCPALPLGTNTLAIQLIKAGSCVFVYSQKVKSYAKRSSVLNGRLPAKLAQQGPPPNNCRCALP